MKKESLSKKARILGRKILSDDEIRFIARRLRKLMGQPFVDLAAEYGLNIEDGLRFHSLSTRLREARQKRGIDLKSASSAIHVPQYRLRDIEAGRLNQAEAAVLQAYVDFLHLTRWFTRWRRVNTDLAARLNLDEKGQSRFNTSLRRPRRGA